MKKFFPRLIVGSLVTGFALGVLELYIGHRFILDPLLYEKDYNFVYESFFQPTYYGFAKSIVVAIVFFLVYLIKPRNKFNPLIVGVLGTALFGLYYYFTFPRTNFYSSTLIAVVHFSFMAIISCVGAKLFKLTARK